MEATELKLSNDNNCLACEAFVKINYAPAMLLHEADLQKIYLVRHEGKDIYLRLVNLQRVPFCKVTSVMTLPATGLESHEWRAEWRNKVPAINDDAEMAVYYYKRVTGATE